MARGHSTAMQEHGDYTSSGESIGYDTSNDINDVEKYRDPADDTQPQLEQNRKGSVTDDPFGDESDAQIKYRTMSWWQAAAVMIAETVSLGILSLPSTFAGVGMVAGVILTIGLGLIATYTGYVFWQFKMRYPGVHNIADVGEIFAGRIGREIGGAAQTIYLIFIMGSHLLTWTVAMNRITSHATCTIVWSVVGLVVFWILTLPRTLKNVSYLSIIAFISIVAAVFTTIIGVGIEKPDPTVHATTTVAFASAFGSVTNIIFAFGGHVAFFTFISELKDPREFPKALWALQICNTILYVVVGVVIYRYAGPGVVSPALGSATETVTRVAYGIALPTIVIAGVIYGHVAAKYIYVRAFRGTKHIHERSLFSFGVWVGITLCLWLVAWIIAESIPVFNDLVGLIASLFASWFTYGLAGFMWLYMNWGHWFGSGKKIALTITNIVICGMGAAICGIGLYASGKSIHEDSSGTSWSCADNSR